MTMMSVLLNNILITIGSCILPIVVDIVAAKGLGLVSTAFKWSFAAGWIAVADASMQMAKTYDVASFSVVLFILFVIVFALETIKVFVKEKL